MILIDGNAIMHRAYHAMPPLTSPDGKSVSVVYGFLSMLLKLYNDLKPTHIVVAFDRPGPTFRDALYEKYQKQRPKIDDDFIGQISFVHDAVKAFGIPVYECDGFEADDVIGTVCQQVTSNKLKVKSYGVDQVIVITGDRDILQLVEDDRVLLFMPTKGLSEGKIYHEADVVLRLGIPPNLIPAYKALAGDQSDNYPGVPGIGPKTAVTILKSYGSISALYKALEGSKTTLSKGTVEKLSQGKESALLGLELATIRKDVPIVFDEKSAIIPTLDTLSARKELEKYGFQSLLRRLTGDSTVVLSQRTKSHEALKKEQIVIKQSTTQQELF